MNSRDNRGKFSPRGNRFEVINELLFCFNDSGDVLFFTDLSNKSIVCNKNWCKVANGYASTHINGKQISIHRLLTNVDEHHLVDHINGLKRDNRNCNLRICNKSLNAFNTGLRKSNSSGKTGVYYRKDTQKWTAEIKKDNRKICLGCFDDIESAINAREKAEVLFYGEVKRCQ